MGQKKKVYVNSFENGTEAISIFYQAEVYVKHWKEFYFFEFNTKTFICK